MKVINETDEIKEKIKEFSSKYSVSTKLFQVIDGISIYGDINEIQLVSDGYGVDVEVFIDGKITDHCYFPYGDVNDQP